MHPEPIWNDDPSVRVVDSFVELISTPFEGECNAVYWQRNLRGSFHEIVDRLAPAEGVLPVGEERLRGLDLSSAGKVAARVILEDLRLLREGGHEPELNAIGSYPVDLDEALPTDVYSFHVDSATVLTDTFLCCYAGRPSEGLLRADALARVDVPERRAQLLASVGGADDDSFAAILKESHQDLHFVERPGARPFSLGCGHLWRVAVQYPSAPVRAFIHRAPRPTADDGRRLLLIS